MAEAPCPHNEEDHPRDSPHHDVLVINPEGVLHRVQVEKRLGHPNEGRYLTTPEIAHFREPGYRKVFNIAHASTHGDGDAEEPREAAQAHGPAFAMLPIKPEPASSNWTCYLINAQRLSYKNPWTVEAWNDEPDAEDQPQAGAQNALTGAFELLIAGPRGDVYLVKQDSQGEPTISKVKDLSQEQDIWNQLRNGCVVGTAEYYDDGKSRIVPLVNVSCLTVPQNGGGGRG